MSEALQKADDILFDANEKRKIKEHLDSFEEIEGAVLITFNQDGTHTSWISRQDFNASVIVGILERVKLKFMKIDLERGMEENE